MKVKQASRLVHEVREGQHRIISFNNDGTNDTGTWVSVNEVASSADGKLFAIQGESVLPQGIFSVRGQEHQVLQ